MIKIELIQISLNRHRRSPSPKPKKPPEKEVLLGENIFFFRACLNFIAQNFYKYFEMDFSIHICRFSGLNQKQEVKNRLKRVLKLSKEKEY